MPRRLPVRPAKVFGNFFVLIVLSVMALIYYNYVFVLFGPRAESKYPFQNSNNDYFHKKFIWSATVASIFSYFKDILNNFQILYRGC